VKLRTRFTDFEEDDFRRGYERAQELVWRAQADASSPESSQTGPITTVRPRESRPGAPRDDARYSSPSHPGR